MSNKYIQTTELDFDQIKSNFKEFLKTQDEYTDYDFEGSGLSILLDILALNTHYNALYYNLAINEAFLDSASKRSSVVSKAKELGYTPKSATASTAKVTVTMGTTNIDTPATLTLDANTPFTTIIDGITYTFYSIQSQTAIKSNYQYIFDNVIIKEGVPLSYSYIYYPNTAIIIPNTNVDRSTLNVVVNGEVYKESSSLIDLLPTSLVYFIRELDDQTYQLEFGNDLIGKSVQAGSTISINYMVCNDENPNGAKTFTYSGSAPSGITSISVITTSDGVAAGGSKLEDIESIRYNAPFAYTTQNRCVTTEDYKSTISSLYTPAKSVNVWGGEDNIPPQYGKVYISIVPEDFSIITDEDKDYIISILNPRKCLTVTPVIVDPNYIRLEIHTTFYYDPTLTTFYSTDLEVLVRDNIIAYNIEQLGKFSNVFKYSKLTTNIDNTDISIKSNITTLKIHYDITPIYNVSNQYIINLGNPIYYSNNSIDSILSTGFTCTDSTEVCYINDLANNDSSGSGILRLFYVTIDGERSYIKNIGSVNYTTGIITINNLTITNIENNFEFIIKPQSNDIIGIQNQCVVIDETLLNINSIAESTTQSYIFTSSRV